MNKNMIFDLIKNNKKVSAILASVLAIFMGFFSGASNVYMGQPKAENFSLKTFTRTLNNPHFSIGYSDYRGNPLWVSYLITPLPKNAKRYKRPSTFSPDWRNITKLETKDYTKSGYDRGHMAPNSAISKIYGKKSQLNTFLMTNITPQKPNLNRKIWRRLEAVALKHFPKYFDKVWVITGPIFDNKIQRLSSSKFIEIPDAFYKIFVGLKGKNKPKVLAFIMPQRVNGNEPLNKYVTTIDDVEKQTGFDFLSKLNDSLETKLEKSKDVRPWHLKEVDRKSL
jgi:endonuclease G